MQGIEGIEGYQEATKGVAAVQSKLDELRIEKSQAVAELAAVTKSHGDAEKLLSYTSRSAAIGMKSEVASVRKRRVRERDQPSAVTEYEKHDCNLIATDGSFELIDVQLSLRSHHHQRE